MQIAERLVAVPGGSVWTRQVGSPERPTVLVLHGGPGMPSDYLEPLAVLADRYRVVFYDQLGCGRSERPDDPALWTEERAVAEVEAVRSALELGEVHVLGHSWGGYLALAYANAHRRHVRSLVLSSPLVSVPLWMRDAKTLIAGLPEAERDAIARCEASRDFTAPEYLAAVDAFYRRHLCRLEPWPQALERTFAGMGEQVYLTMWGPSEFTQTGSLRDRDLSPVLAGLGLPSLWLAGEYDEAAPATLAKLADMAAGSLTVLKEASHCAHLEQPDAYLAAVRGFLARHPENSSVDFSR